MSNTNGSLTITEGLAEIKTLGKRIAKRREGMSPYLARVEAMKDPLANDGGSVEFIKRELQAIGDMEARIVELRRKIAFANSTTELAINGTARSVSDWLTWRREVAPQQVQFLSVLLNQIRSVRQQAQQKGVQLISAAAAVNVSDVKAEDILVNVSEKDLADESDRLQETLGNLDGKLSLANATTTIE